ncbi:group II intron maturase-specific domain-containing protein [Rhodococcus pseudokoreensis]|nr:group II intron maturase-specific domain-containing protein [Rhodococcus pseudokoreensis]
MISPLMCNVFLHRIDRVWDVREHGVLVRFADDAVVMCRTREQAEAALMRLRELLAELGLEPKEAKTRIVHLKLGGEGLDFLGFHHRWVRAQGRTGGKGVEFLARWPSDKAMQHARDRIRGLTGSNRTLLSVDGIVGELNSFLRGWAGYFRYGNSSARFTKIRHYALTRVVGMLAKKHRRSRRFGMWVVSQSSDNQLGLISLDGIVFAPRPFRAWRVTPNAGGERRR